MEALGYFWRLEDRFGLGEVVPLAVQDYRPKVRPEGGADGYAAELERCRGAGDKGGEADLLVMMSAQEEDGPEALRGGRAALALFRDLGDAEGEVKALLVMAAKQLLKEDPREALRFASEAQVVSRRQGYVKGELAALRTTVRAHLDKGAKVEAVREARDAAAWFEKSGDLFSQAAALDVLSQAHLGNDQKSEALRAGWDSMRLLRGLGDPVALARALVAVAMLHLANGQEDWALEAVREARAVSEEAGDRRGEALAQHALLHAYQQKNESEPALAAGNQAQGLFRDVKDKRWMASTLLALCGVYRSSGKVQLASSSAQRARWVFEEVGDRKGQADALVVAAEIYHESGELDRAMRAAKKAQAILDAGGYLKSNAIALHLVANVHLARDEPEDATRLAIDSRTLSKRVDYKKGEGLAMLMLANAGLNQAMRENTKMEKIRPHTEEVIDENPAPPMQYGMPAPEFFHPHVEFDIADKQQVECEKQWEVLKDALERAVKVAKEAVLFASKADDKELYASTLHTLGQVQIMNNQAEDALKSASHALMLGRERNDKHREAMSLILSAQAYLACQKSDEALSAAERGVRMAKKAGKGWAEAYGNQVLEQITGGPVAPPPEEKKEGEGEEEVKEEEEFVGLDPANVRDQVREEVAQLIGLDEDSLFDDTPLMDSGMDSLSSVEFRNVLAKDFSMNLPATITFDFPSIKSLTGFIVEQSYANAPKHMRDRRSVAAPKPKAEAVQDNMPAGAAVAVSRKGDAKVKKPCIAGTWDNWAMHDMQWDEGLAVFHATVQLGINGWESFQVLYEGDWKRCLYPEQKDACPHVQHNLLGPDDDGHGQNWTIGKHEQDFGGEGVCYQVRLFLGEGGVADKLEWTRLGNTDTNKQGALGARLPQPEASGPLGRRHPYLIGTWNNWGTVVPMVWDDDGQNYRYSLQLGRQGWESFQVLMGGEWKKCLHPDRKDGCPHLPHELIGPDAESHGKNWTVGRHPLDNGAEGATFDVRLHLGDQQSPERVDWVRL